MVGSLKGSDAVKQAGCMRRQIIHLAMRITVMTGATPMAIFSLGTAAAGVEGS